MISGRVIEIEEGETTELAQDMEAFLTRLADDLEAGRQGVDDALIDEESFEVVFDAGRERTPGERVKHSVFETLGLEATVESLADHASAFDRRPYVHGFYVRMVPRAPGVGVGAVRLDDERGRPVSAECGHSSGGGRPGFCVFVQSALEPIPQGSRLVVELVRKRRV